MKYFMRSLVVSCFLALLGTQVHASSPNLVIAQVQAGGVGGESPAAQEFISLFNNSDQDVDLTGWCLTNKAATITCLQSSSPSIRLYLHAHAYATIASNQFKLAHPDIAVDFTYTPLSASSGSITAGADTLTLTNTNNQAVDMVSWTSSLNAGSLLARKAATDNPANLIDTDGAADFIKITSLVVPASGVYEVQTIIDTLPEY